MSRVCLQCREPFNRDRRPWESRSLRDYHTPHTELRVTAWGHICKPCAIRESQDAPTSRTKP
jgi:hypothetical protein